MVVGGVRGGRCEHASGTMPPGAGCAGLVVQLAFDAGENGGVAEPSAISGTGRSAHTDGTGSVGRRPRRQGLTGTGRASSTAEVPTVKRDGRWWVAAPQAVNPAVAARGGLTESQLGSG
jgi:hypothetical protein